MNAEPQLDLCQELLTQFTAMQFKPQSVEIIRNHRHFVSAVSGGLDVVQKTYLTLALADILNNGPQVVPSEIRLGLNMAGNVLDWLTDIKLIVLPFIHANEEVFFQGQAYA